MIKCPNCGKDDNLVNFGAHYICLNCGGKKYSVEEVEKDLIDYKRKLEELEND